METGNKFYDNLPDYRKKKYAILFESIFEWIDKHGKKDLSKTEDKIEEFNQCLKKFIAIQADRDKYDLAFICFPIFNPKDFFPKNKIKNKISFYNAKFISKANFEKITFAGETNFKKSKFYEEAIFDEALFIKKVSFWGANFLDKVHFDSTIFKQTFNFTNTTIKQITLKNTDIKNGNFLGICSQFDRPLEKNNFNNKESARLIKDHFEKQNNIAEANKYFRIEQELYILELQGEIEEEFYTLEPQNKREKFEKNEISRSDIFLEPNRVGTQIALFFNKWVSDFGTNWIRAIFALIIWGVIAKWLLYSAQEMNLITRFNYFFDLFCFIAGVTIIIFISKKTIHANQKFYILLFALIIIVLIFIYLIQIGFGLFFFFVILILIYSATYSGHIISVLNQLTVSKILILALFILFFSLSKISIFNEISNLINPFNFAGFSKDGLFENHQAVGFFIRAVSLAIIYQIIVAFRQNTRRK